MFNTILKDFFTDIDLYDDQIRFLQYPFTSPIGKDAVDFYRFYIEDTVYVGPDRCFHLQFTPNNQQDFGFRGEIYVLADTTLHVKRCVLTLPKSSVVNFVDNLRIYASLDDWFTFSNYIGFDPEITGTGSSQGVDKGSYPTAKKVVFGVNITF